MSKLFKGLKKGLEEASAEAQEIPEPESASQSTCHAQ